NDGTVDSQPATFKVNIGTPPPVPSTTDKPQPQQGGCSMSPATTSQSTGGLAVLGLLLIAAIRLRRRALAFLLVLAGACSDSPRAGFENPPFQYPEEMKGSPGALTIMRSGDGDGAVQSDPMGLSCGSSCRADFPYDTLVTLTATPAAGS